jgi:hypothetical protein
VNSVPNKFSGESIDNDKKRGEWAEMHFMSRATEHGLQVSKPFGDSARYDFAVEANGRFLRVQVKSTMCRHNGGYICKIVHNHGMHYASGDVDFFAVFVIPEDVWYVVPAEIITCGQSHLTLSPRRKGQKHEAFKEAWHLLKESLARPSQESSPAPASDPGLVSTDNCQPTTGNCPGDIGEMQGAVDPPPAIGYDHDLIRRRVAACFDRIRSRR